MQFDPDTGKLKCPYCGHVEDPPQKADAVSHPYLAALNSTSAHVQIADNPGRNEPGTGEINYRFLFGFLDSIGYTGWNGCEYKPKARPSADSAGALHMACRR